MQTTQAVHNDKYKDDLSVDRFLSNNQTPCLVSHTRGMHVSRSVYRMYTISASWILFVNHHIVENEGNNIRQTTRISVLVQKRERGYISIDEPTPQPI